jgi:hypothetical protein
MPGLDRYLQEAHRALGRNLCDPGPVRGYLSAFGFEFFPLCWLKWHLSQPLTVRYPQSLPPKPWSRYVELCHPHLISIAFGVEGMALRVTSICENVWPDEILAFDAKSLRLLALSLETGEARHISPKPLSDGTLIVSIANLDRGKFVMIDNGTRKRILSIDAAGTICWEQLGRKGRLNELVQPSDIKVRDLSRTALDGTKAVEKQLFVCDSRTNLLHMLNDRGLFVATYKFTDLNTPIREPCALAFDHEGLLYVCSAIESHIAVLRVDDEGIEPHLYIRDSRLERPCSIAMDHFGNVLIADSAKLSILVLSWKQEQTPSAKSRTEGVVTSGFGSPTTDTHASATPAPSAALALQPPPPVPLVADSQPKAPSMAMAPDADTDRANEARGFIIMRVPLAHAPKSLIVDALGRVVIICSVTSTDSFVAFA